MSFHRYYNRVIIVIYYSTLARTANSLFQNFFGMIIPEFIKNNEKLVFYKFIILFIAVLLTEFDISI